MSLWNLQEIAHHLGARIIGDGSFAPTSVSIDSRFIQPGSCFVALRAQRDGHTFAPEALAAGAGALLVEEELPLPCPQLVVRNTLAALQRWGQVRLACFRPALVAAVTGSAGKTTTKELLAAALGHCQDPDDLPVSSTSTLRGWKTPGNRNNGLGLPEALATLPRDLDFAVLEMGMSTPGEIRRLTELAPPDRAILTSVGSAHIENFPEGLRGIARAKGELVEGLRPGGTWVYWSENAWGEWISRQLWAQHSKATAVGPGTSWEVNAEPAGARGSSFLLRGPQLEQRVQLDLAGSHNVQNAALALVLAIQCGRNAEEATCALARVQPEPGRGRIFPLDSGAWILDESYNANPDSVLACTQSLLRLPGGEPVAILGCMLELGEKAECLHQQTGGSLKAMGLSRLWVFGEHARAMAEGFGKGAHSFRDFNQLVQASDGLSALPSGARILVKGSRGYRTERVVEWLRHNSTHSISTLKADPA